MRYFRTFLTLTVLLGWNVASRAASPKNPIRYHIVQTSVAQTNYAPGDTVRFRILAIQPDLSCTDGVEKTRILVKGLRLLKQSNWQEISAGKWQKELSALIGTNPAKGIQLTAYRETDAGKSVETFTIKP